MTRWMGWSDIRKSKIVSILVKIVVRRYEFMDGLFDIGDVGKSNMVGVLMRMDLWIVGVILVMVRR